MGNMDPWKNDGHGHEYIDDPDTWTVIKRQYLICSVFKIEVAEIRYKHP